MNGLATGSGLIRLPNVSANAGAGSSLCRANRIRSQLSHCDTGWSGKICRFNRFMRKLHGQKSEM
ncbi:hypothetical protein KCP71_18465 [Salmonella enterica subsp. enterica]|nr:hypothetical protein KCP71_18465 [Salmonella enterica subsp. enterica]